MKFWHIACVLGLVALPSACAERAAQSGAPASSPGTVNSAPVVAEPTQAVPARSAAPQGLDQAERAESSARDDDFTTLEAAEHALNRAESELDRLARTDSSASLGRAAPADGASRAEKKDAQRVAAPSAAGPPPSVVCVNACRAFASLSRAANAVCRLAGDNGTHCTRAKRMVADSQPRVASCACIPAD